MNYFISILLFFLCLPHFSSLAEQSPSSSQLSNHQQHTTIKHLKLTPHHQPHSSNPKQETQTKQNDHVPKNQSSKPIIKHSPESKSQLIPRIIKLLQHSRNLHRDILYEREQNEKATAHFQNSLKKLSDMTETRANVQKSLRLIKHDLKDYHRQSPLYATTTDILHRQIGAALLEINRLTTSKYSVIHEKALLQDHFRHRGLEAWVQNYLKGSVNPLVAGAVVEGTADVVEPVLDGIETLASVNQDLARRMASRIRESVPIVEKPFYSGFVTYAVLLFPLVLVTSVLLKIKRSLTRFSVGHFVILGNFYFTLLSGGCFIATSLGSVDVLRTFRHVNLGLFDLVMVLHGILYMIHVSLHVMMAFRAKDKTMAMHTVFLILVGTHFFLHSYLHAMHNQDPHVDKTAYAIYTGTFAYVLYNWTVKHIRMSMEKTKMKLYNKSISTIEKQSLATVTVNPGSPVLRQKSMIPSSKPYTFSDMAVSRKEVALRGKIRVDNIFYTPPTIAKERDESVGTTIAGPSTMRSIVRMNADDPKDL